MVEHKVPTVFEAVAAVAAGIGAVGKNQKMEAGPARYSYRGLDDLIDAVHVHLAAHAVTFAPSRIQVLDTLEKVTRSGSTQYHLRAIVTYKVYGPAGDFFEASVLAEGTDSGDKAGNKLMSGAYKYALGQVLSIPFSMDDQDANVPENVLPDPEPPATWEEAQARLEALAGANGRTVEQITAKFRKANGDLDMDGFRAMPLGKVAPLVVQIEKYTKAKP
jgi:hypothetical protein